MDVREIVNSFGTESVSEEFVEESISKIIHENANVISQKGLDSVGLLMGRCMEVLRGKIDGEKVNKILMAKLTDYLKNTKH